MRQFILSFLLLGVFCSQAQTADDFVYTVDIQTNGGRIDNYSLILTAPGTLNIDWGDGQSTTHSSLNFEYVFHTYAAVGTYTIIIEGQIDSFRISSGGQKDIQQWGSSQFKSMHRAFSGARRLQISATDQPDLSLVTDMSYMFDYTYFFNSDISTWDTSNVVNMEGLFKQANDFNQPLNSWDVSSVTNMKSMFEEAATFNQSLSGWDVSNVTDMSFMFKKATDFNQNINGWDVSAVTTMEQMFYEIRRFNNPLDNWNVSNVTSFSYMFAICWDFNQPLNGWDVSSATDFSGMFNYAGYEQPLSNWDVSNATDLSWMFSGSSFNGDISMWDISNAVNLNFMFSEARNFNQNLGSWNFNNSMSFLRMIPFSGLDTVNFDELLRRFLELDIVTTLNAQNLEYCDSFTRNALINNGFVITGDDLASNCQQNLSGKIRYDQDNDGCNETDVSVSSLPVRISNNISSIDVFSVNGNYSTNLPHGTYLIEPLHNSSLFNVTPSSSTITITNETQSFNENFCLTAAAAVDDLEISLLPLGDARPGFETTYKMIYQNNGTSTLSGNIDFNYDERLMTYSSSTPVISSSAIRTLNWTFSNLAPFEVREILVSFTLNTPTDVNFPLNSGDVLGLYGTISHPGTEVTPRNNRFDLKHEVVNSFDPNDKTCLQGNVIAPEMVGEYVHYRIRFENEGTASAVNVRIVDYIDLAKFDITTLTPLSSSHDYTAKITEGNKVEFIFDNIQLPFTAPASQGYVLFKIKTLDTLVLGDDFSNQAEIYFDFNFPIITNLETTAVDVIASVADHLDTSFKMIPNPASNQVQLSAQFSFNKVSVFDSLGNLILIKEQGFDATSASLDISTMASGLYFVQIDGGSQGATQKLIIN